MVVGIPLYGPRWFNGIDCAFDIVSILAALSIWFFARRANKLTGNPKLLPLGNAFLLIAISFLIKIVTNTATYLKLNELGPMIVFSKAIEAQIMFASGYFLYRLLFLVALIWMVCLGLGVEDWRLKLLLVIFAAVGTFFSQYSYVVFHLIALVLLTYIVALAYGRFQESKKARSRTIAASFFLIMISQVMFLFVGLEPAMYVAGETLQLAGFVGMLYNQMTLPRSSRHGGGVKQGVE